MKNDSRIIVALDFPSAASALELVDLLDPSKCALKVGKELFVRAGPVFVENLVKKGFKVFLDLKFHDIPNTVAQACKAAADLGVWMMNVHASGGSEMMIAAKDALSGILPEHRPLLVGVTVLTSMNDDALEEIGIAKQSEILPMVHFTSPESEHTAALPQTTLQVLRLAALVRKSGLDGVVCSAQESEILRTNLGPTFLLVTPGIRLPEGNADDQVRIMTPGKAIKAGADYLVVGRPITKAADPLGALEVFNQHVRATLANSN